MKENQRERERYWKRNKEINKNKVRNNNTTKQQTQIKERVIYFVEASAIFLTILRNLHNIQQRKNTTKKSTNEGVERFLWNTSFSLLKEVKEVK